MGREADVKKARLCRYCKQYFACSADPMKKHIALCKRGQASNLILPGIQPGERLNIVDDD